MSTWHPKYGNGRIYIIHFMSPYKHAGHYVGYTRDVGRRIRKHLSGRGARLLSVAQENGIKWVVAKTMPGDRIEERRLKSRGSARRICPICRGEMSVSQSIRRYRSNKIVQNHER